VLGDDALAQALEREPRHRSGETVEPLPERAQQAHIALLQSRRHGPLDAGEERPTKCRAAQEDERVVRHADEGRGEHADERTVVVAVLQESQVREQVDHLLRSEEHTSELQSLAYLVCRLLLEKKKKKHN